MSYGSGVDNQARYEAAIARRIARACYDKFHNKFMPTHPEVDWERARLSRNSFVRGLLVSGEKYGKLSDKQLAAITTSFERDDARTAEREVMKQELIDAGVKAPSGRKIVQGKIVSKKWESNKWGSTCKILLAHKEGWKIWMTLSESVDDANVGDVIETTISLEPSEKDPLFAIGKRPAKTIIIEHSKIEHNN